MLRIGMHLSFATCPLYQDGTTPRSFAHEGLGSSIGCRVNRQRHF